MAGPRYQHFVDLDETPLPLSVVEWLPPQPGQVVGSLYAFQAVGTTLFKIGFSEWPGRRLCDIQPYSPLELRWVATWSFATRSLECAVHRLLADSRRHGEWFDLGWLGDQLVDFNETFREIVAEAIDPSGWAVRPA